MRISYLKYSAQIQNIKIKRETKIRMFNYQSTEYCIEIRGVWNI